MEDADLEDLIDDEMSSILSSLTSDEGAARKANGRSKRKSPEKSKPLSKTKPATSTTQPRVGSWDKLDPQFGKRSKVSSNARPKVTKSNASRKRANQSASNTASRSKKRRSQWESQSETSADEDPVITEGSEDESEQSLSGIGKKGKAKSNASNKKSPVAKSKTQEKEKHKDSNDSASEISDEHLLNASRRTGRSSTINAKPEAPAARSPVNASGRNLRNLASANYKTQSPTHSQTSEEETETADEIKTKSETSVETPLPPNTRAKNSPTKHSPKREIAKPVGKAKLKVEIRAPKMPQRRSTSASAKSPQRQPATKSKSKDDHSSKSNKAKPEADRGAKSPKKSSTGNRNSSSTKRNSVTISDTATTKTKRTSSTSRSPKCEPEGAYRPYSPRKSVALSPQLLRKLEVVDMENQVSSESLADDASKPHMPTGALFDPVLDKRLKVRCVNREAALHIIKTAQETLESVVERNVELSETARSTLFYSILRELRLRKAEILVERLNQQGYLDFDDDEEWEVEEIVDVEEDTDGLRQYWIKWIGWRTLTLEPADKLTHCHQLISDFEESRTGGNRRKARATTATDIDNERTRQRSQIDAFLRVVREKYKWTSEINMSELLSLVREVGGEALSEYPREQPVVAPRKRSSATSAKQRSRKSVRNASKYAANVEPSEDERGTDMDTVVATPSIEPVGEDVDERRKANSGATVLKNGRKCLTQMSKKQARGQREVARKYLREFEALLKRTYPKMFIRVENDVDNEVPPANYEYVTEYKLGDGVISLRESPIWCECPANCWPVTNATATAPTSAPAATNEATSENQLQPPSVSTVHSQANSNDLELNEVQPTQSQTALSEAAEAQLPTVVADSNTTVPSTAQPTTTTNGTTKRKRGFDTPPSCCPAIGAKIMGVDPNCAYDRNKRVNWEPGVVIFECGKKCRCDPSCPNRVVQLGSKVRLCVFRTTDRGWGVKTLQYIPAGRFVIEYLGEVITNEEADRRGHNYDDEGLTFLFDLDLNDEDRSESSRHYTVDAKHCGNITHFLNHSCDPNLAVYNVFIDSVDPALPRLALFATRAVMAGEELTFDYQRGKQLDDSVLHLPNADCPPQTLGEADVQLHAEKDGNTNEATSSESNALPNNEQIIKINEPTISAADCEQVYSEFAPASSTLDALDNLLEPGASHDADLVTADVAVGAVTETPLCDATNGPESSLNDKSMDINRSPAKDQPAATVDEHVAVNNGAGAETEIAENHQQRRMKCLCKAANCRGWLFLV